jgi:hypothetical protein
MMRDGSEGIDERVGAHGALKDHSDPPSLLLLMRDGIGSTDDRIGAYGAIEDHSDPPFLTSMIMLSLVH